MYEDFQMAMQEPSWPEWGGDMDRYYPWHIWTSPAGAHHAGHLLDTVIGPSVETSGMQQVYEVLRCEPCVAIHVTPLPSAEALAQYYATTFYDKDKPEYLVRTECDRDWWKSCVWRPLLKECRQLIRCGSWTKARGLRLLDIGCGPAVSLDVGKSLFMETHGIEPNKAVCELARIREHILYHGTLESCTDGDSDDDYEYDQDIRQSFHIITAYEVLEHQACPEDFLLRCYDLLEPGGVLMVEVPNDYSSIQLLAREQLHIKPWWLAPPQHLFYWTPKTLQLCVRRAGFTILDMRGTYPIDQALFHGQNYIGNDVIGRQVHTARMQWELDMVHKGKWSQVEAEYRVNLQHRIGREIVCIARKEAL